MFRDSAPCVCEKIAVRLAVFAATASIASAGSVTPSFTDSAAFHVVPQTGSEAIVGIDNVSFGTATVVQSTGACCADVTGVCTDDVTRSVCEGTGGRYGGDGSTCTTLSPPRVEPETPAPVPAVTLPGMVVLSGTLLIGLAVKARRSAT